MYNVKKDSQKKEDMIPFDVLYTRFEGGNSMIIMKKDQSNEQIFGVLSQKKTLL
jgi:hypothetical protein